jgi:ribonuclease G
LSKSKKIRKEIVINSTLNEVRIAITENGKLAEFFIETPDKERSVGNIYLGRVKKIVPGLNAAFVDIGFGQDAFLHFSDIEDSSYDHFITDEEDKPDDDEMSNEPDDYEDVFDEINISEDDDEEETITDTKKSFETSQTFFYTKRNGPVEINLEENQKIIVQIVREAYRSKGVKVTTKISLPGRYVVLMPFENIIGISKKITSYKERKRLRYLARTALPKGSGCIIRTAARGKNEKELLRDWKQLVKTWREIEQKIKKAEGATLLYNDMELATSVIRDLFNKDIEKVYVDSKKLYKEISGYVKWSAPNLLEKIEQYTDKKPIFDAFGIEKELEQTYKTKVNLHSGGSIVLEQTEAMHVIDVNSGKSTSEKRQETTAMKTNLEAIHEIARQIRLRDMAGMILIDFIDVYRRENKKKIFDTMRRELSRDRSKTIVYPLTELCILQITRQRINQNISEKLTETCPVCHGTGRIASKSVLFNSIERWLKNFRIHSREFKINLIVHPHIAAYLTEGALSRMSRLMIKYFVKIKLIQDENIPIDTFKFESVRQKKDITQEYRKS